MATVTYDPATEVVLVLPRELAERGYWHDMEAHELECLCEEQLRKQGLWADYEDYTRCQEKP